MFFFFFFKFRTKVFSDKSQKLHLIYKEKLQSLNNNQKKDFDECSLTLDFLVNVYIIIF